MREEGIVVVGKWYRIDGGGWCMGGGYRVEGGG